MKIKVIVKPNAKKNEVVVTKPFVVLSGPTMPYYGQPGLGTQYLSPYNVDDLLRLGYIR
jgi:3-dehydroquinate synthase class II